MFRLVCFFSCFPLELSKVGHEILITITIRFFIFSMCLSSLETVLLLGCCVLFCCCFDMMNSLTIDLMCSRRHSVVTSGTNARRRRGKLWKIEIRWKKLLKKMWKNKISDNFFFSFDCKLKRFVIPYVNRNKNNNLTDGSFCVCFHSLVCLDSSVKFHLSKLNRSGETDPPIAQNTSTSLTNECAGNFICAKKKERTNNERLNYFV